MKDERTLIKLLLIGESGVGKSSLLNRFSDNIFVDYHSATIGVDFRIKTFKIDDKYVKVELWDSTGHKRFRDIIRTFYKKSDGIIILFDLSDHLTIKNINLFLDEVETFAPKNAFKIIVGNKLDLERKIIKDQIKSTYDYFEISVKDNMNIEQLFDHIINKILNKEEEMPTIKKTKKNVNCLLKILKYVFKF